MLLIYIMLCHLVRSVNLFGNLSEFIVFFGFIGFIATDAVSSDRGGRNCIAATDEGAIAVCASPKGPEGFIAPPSPPGSFQREGFERFGGVRVFAR